MAFNNNLTPAEQERLEMLAEEAAETIQVIMKILRHGYESYHPANPSVTNRELLETEIGDFLGILEEMVVEGDVQPDNLEFHKQEKWKNALPYTHHQKGSPVED